MKIIEEETTADKDVKESGLRKGSGLMRHQTQNRN